jgi:hypothetical protein
MAIKIILLIIGFGLGTFFGVALEDKGQILAVLTVIGTVGAVIWAVSRDTILKYINRPQLDVSFYETNPPYLRYVPPEQEGQTPQHVLTLVISNSGKTIAEWCQPLITNIWIKDGENWTIPSGWVPLPLRWVFQSELRQENVLEMNIFPNKPYLFNLCNIMEDNTFRLSALIWSRSQSATFPGQTTYCIEVTIFSVNAKPRKNYIYIEWKGPFDKDLLSFENDIKIYESNERPK